jgi:hypothetical protein
MLAFAPYGTDLWVQVNLLFAGLLAGEEFVIRYGVRGPVATLDVRPQIQLRQALIRKLRILVPIMFGLALVSAVMATIQAGAAQGARYAGIVSLLVFICVTLFGTVPINAAALEWNANSPPENWRAMMQRWEHLDSVRTWAAVLALMFFLASTVPPG